MSAAIPLAAETNKPPRPRRWIPLSLKMFGALVAIISAFTGWEGLRIYRQQVAFREIERLGGTVGTQPDCPTWLKPWLGAAQIKLLDRIVDVDLPETAASDETLAHLWWLTGLRRLNLDGAQISDAGLARLRTSTSLDDLKLDRTRITDAGLAHLKDLPALQSLSLSETQITDAGLDHLKSCRHLRLLHVVRTQVSDAGIADLKRHLPDISVWKLADRGHPSSQDASRLSSVLSDFAADDLQGLDGFELGQLDVQMRRLTKGAPTHVRQRPDRSEPAMLKDQSRAITGSVPDAGRMKPHGSMYLKPFHSGEVCWLVLQAGPINDVPDATTIRVHVFDRDWTRIATQEIVTRAAFRVAELNILYENPTDESLLVATIASTVPAGGQENERRLTWERAQLQRQYYALTGGRFVMVRLEGADRQIVPNDYRGGAHVTGPTHPQRTAKAWIRCLSAGNPTDQLATLVWLTGTHLSSQTARDSDVERESIADSELVEEVRSSAETERALRELVDSMEPWVQEYAELALKGIGKP
jgi:hypothetical protein